MAGKSRGWVHNYRLRPCGDDERFVSPQVSRGSVSLVSEVKKASEFEVVQASEAMTDAGISIFRDRADKDWSLTDCISFFTMTERGMTRL
jgi:predicted nucleic acid-binding protein